MKQALTLCQSATFAAVRLPNLNEVAKRLDALNDLHANLTQKLRELHADTSLQTLTQIKWHDFKSQVVKLRFEMENFKQIF